LFSGEAIRLINCILDRRMEFGKVSRYDLLYYNKVNGCADNHRTHAYYQFDNTIIR